MLAPYKGKSEPWKKVCTSKDWSISILDSLGGRIGITYEFRYHQVVTGYVDGKKQEVVLEPLFNKFTAPGELTSEDLAKEAYKNYTSDNVYNKNSNKSVFFQE